MDFFYYFDVRLVSEIKIVEANYRFYSLQIPSDLKDSIGIPHTRCRLAAAQWGPQEPIVEGRRGSQGDPTTDSPLDADSR